MSQLTLKHFILQQEAINLYRLAVRSSKRMSISVVIVLKTQPSLSALGDASTRRETIKWIRSEFERNRYLTDVVCIFSSFDNIQLI